MSETVVNLVDDVSRIDEISNGNAEASRICEKSLARILGLVRGLGGGDGDEDDHRGEHSNDYSANEVEMEVMKMRRPLCWGLSSRQYEVDQARSIFF